MKMTELLYLCHLGNWGQGLATDLSLKTHYNNEEDRNLLPFWTEIWVLSSSYSKRAYHPPK
jgi:hypothetical protein